VPEPVSAEQEKEAAVGNKWIFDVRLCCGSLTQEPVKHHIINSISFHNQIFSGDGL